jgi:excisionase family DNA binding protein
MMSILKNLRGRTAPLNVKALAGLLDVTEGTIRRWVQRRQVPAIRVGDVIRFDPGMLADWIELQAAYSQRYQDGLYRFIRVRDHALGREGDGFQMSREDLGEEFLKRMPELGTAPTKPEDRTGTGQPDEA